MGLIQNILMTTELPSLPEPPIHELFDIFSDESDSWAWYFDNILDGEAPTCSHDRCEMAFTFGSKFYKYWRCPKCKKKQSAYKGTSLESMKIPLRKFLLIILLYYIGISALHIGKILGLSDNTVLYWTSVVRVRCTALWNHNQTKIGGPGTTVEIDEAVWRRRKYRRGRRKKQIWIFGAVERKPEGGAGRNFVMIVPNRKSETLIPIIMEKILPGTLILSDEWRAYAKLNQFGYTHNTVCHKREFVNKVTGACTNTVESLWMNLRSHFPRYGCREKFLGDYLSLWLVKRNLKPRFSELIKEIVFDATRKADETGDTDADSSEDTLSETESDILDEQDLLDIPASSESDPLGAGDGADASDFSPEDSDP